MQNSYQILNKNFNQQDPDFGKIFEEYFEPLIPSLAANALVMIAQMVVPQFLSSSTSIPNFAGPQPGTPGGGASPSATPANPTVISGKMYLKQFHFVFKNKNISRLYLTLTSRLYSQEVMFLLDLLWLELVSWWLCLICLGQMTILQQSQAWLF